MAEMVPVAQSQCYLGNVAGMFPSITKEMILATWQKCCILAAKVTLVSANGGHIRDNAGGLKWPFQLCNKNAPTTHPVNMPS